MLSSWGQWGLAMLHTNVLSVVRVQKEIILNFLWQFSGRLIWQSCSNSAAIAPHSQKVTYLIYLSWVYFIFCSDFTITKFYLFLIFCYTFLGFGQIRFSLQVTMSDEYDLVTGIEGSCLIGQISGVKHSHWSQVLMHKAAKHK